MIGLAGALVNRCTLSFFINNVDRVLSDYKRAIQIAREHGFPILECITVKDLGEIYLLIGRPEEAEPLAQRSIELSVQTYGEGVSRVFNAQLLLARLKWYQGDVEAARELVATVGDGAELFLYPGDKHLFADSSLPSYDADAAALLTKRVLDFLARA